MYTFFSLILVYLISSIPFGLVYSKYFAFGDIRSIGSGNIGAANAWRAGGFGLSLATFLSDFAKGYISIWLIASDTPELAAPIAVLGHVFPVWLFFKGGKGVSTGYGVIAAMSFVCTLNLGLFWAAFFWFWRNPGLASILTFVLAPIVAYMYHISLWSVLLISIIVLWAHRTHILKLWNQWSKN